jgi:hypothetical protein
VPALPLRRLQISCRIGRNTISLISTSSLGVRESRREVKVRVEGRLTFNGTFQMLNAAVSGFGLAFALLVDALRYRD